jgi:hypothetical protein
MSGTDPRVDGGAGGTFAPGRVASVDVLGIGFRPTGASDEVLGSGGRAAGFASDEVLGSGGRAAGFTSLGVLGIAALGAAGASADVLGSGARPAGFAASVDVLASGLRPLAASVDVLGSGARGGGASAAGFCVGVAEPSGGASATTRGFFSASAGAASFSPSRVPAAASGVPWTFVV